MEHETISSLGQVTTKRRALFVHDDCSGLWGGFSPFIPFALAGSGISLWSERKESGAQESTNTPVKGEEEV